MAIFLYYAAAFIVFAHGLVHLIGVVVYWQLAEINDIPYKTILLNGRLDIGVRGTRIFGLLWIVPTVGFVAAAAGMLFQQAWWLPILLITTLISLVLTVLDWEAAKFGAILNVLILIVLLITQLIL